MTGTRCPYDQAPLAPLPVGSALTFFVDDVARPAVIWLRCVRCWSTSAIPLVTPGRE